MRSPTHIVMFNTRRPGNRSASQSKPSLLSRLAADESGNALPEYAIVLTSLSIIAILAFNLLGSTSTTVVTTNQNNLSGSATMSYQH